MKRKTPFSVPEVQTVNVKHSDTNTVLTCIHKKLWQNFWVKVWFFYWFTRLKTVGIFSSKGPFTWRWRTLGRWGNPFRWGKNITRVYTQSYNHAIPGYTSQYYWMVAKHVDKTNWRANDVFWRFCCSCRNLSELWLPIVTLMLQSLRQRQGYPTLTRLHGKIWPWLRGLFGLAHWATRLDGSPQNER